MYQVTGDLQCDAEGRRCNGGLNFTNNTNMNTQERPKGTQAVSVKQYNTVLHAATLASWRHFYLLSVYEGKTFKSYRKTEDFLFIHIPD